MSSINKYTANYAYTNPNFVIQNLVVNHIKSGIKPLLYILKNILQRGFPTIMSKYLQQEIGEIHKAENFEERFLFVTDDIPQWNNTIGGDNVNNYNPAKYFFENILPKEFEEYPFLPSLIVPEIEINEIIESPAQEFINQRVDFYLPQARLVIEIDGKQHENGTQLYLDRRRNQYLTQNGIATVRITTNAIKTNTYQNGVNQIRNRINQYSHMFDFYKKAYKILNNNITDDDIITKLLPTAIIRFQVLVLELLLITILISKVIGNLTSDVTKISTMMILQNTLSMIYLFG